MDRNAGVGAKGCAMSETVGDQVLARLREWGVEQVFAYPGDGINGIVAAFGKADDSPAFIQSRHEEMSAFQAVGYAKFSGKVGVCMATSGPGAIHLLNGLYDAKLDHVPVVAIVGQTERSAMGGSYQQEVDLQALFSNVASEYLVEVNVPEQLPLAIDRAFRTAMTRRAPTAIIIPSDLQAETYSPPQHAFKQVPSSPPPLHAPTVVPHSAEIARAAEVLNAGQRVAILVGQGARGAADEVAQVADVLGAGVAKALLGKDVLSDELPFVTGSIGILGTRPTYEMMRDCDTLLIVGSNMPYSQFLPEFGKARAVQIDLDGTLIGMRYPIEVNLVGDAAATLRALLPQLSGPTDRAWREKIEDDVVAWWGTMERQAMLDAKPVNPMRIVWELSERLPHNAIVAADSGSVANWYARFLKMRGDVRGSLSGTLATMGAAVPYAIGRQVRPPEPAGDRAHRRRRHADERNGRAADDEAVRRPLVRPAADHRDPAQQRPQSGHVGAAGDGRRAEVRGEPGAPRCLVRRLRAGHRPVGDHGDVAGRARAGLGRGAGRRPTGGARHPLRPRGARFRRTPSSPRSSR